MSTKFLARIAFCSVLIVATSINMAAACSCFNTHVQKQVCQSDFVIVARVKKEISTPMTLIYKIKIKKEFQVTEKARMVLKKGRIVTASNSAMCGAKLKQDETYVMTGRIIAGQARISLCSYYEPWRDTTVRQRKGFRLLYKQNCLCEIVDCPWWKKCPKESSKEFCMWQTSESPSANSLDCQAKHAICMKTRTGHCNWSVDKKFSDCMKARRRLREEELSREP